MSADAQRQAHASIAFHSKSFALASRLLPPAVANDAVVLYAYCRRVDDTIDLAPASEHQARLARLHREVDDAYADGAIDDPLLAELRHVIARRGVPRTYLDELIAGMVMDAENVAYRSWDELLRYCYRAAGTVGLMMCHVMGVRRPEALVHAAHLGMAMQLTNIARDVLEDWQRGRLYLPDDLLAQQGAQQLRARLGEVFPRAQAGAVAAATAALLDRADAYYRSGDAGMNDLSARCGLAVRTARQVYSLIGQRVRAQRCDPLAGRAVVSNRAKALAVGRSALATLSSAALWRRDVLAVPTVCLGDVSQVPLP